MISRTAKILASRRALEFEKENPLIRDQFAKLFADQESIEFASKTNNEIHYVLMRHKILDDLVALNLGNLKQVVLLGCGFDTKSLRYNGKGARFLEVDNPAIFRLKRRVLDNYDYNKVETQESYIDSPNDLKIAIQNTDPSQPTLVIAEGFFMYLDSETAFKSFNLLSEYYGRNLVAGFDALSTEYANSKKKSRGTSKAKR